MGHSTARFFKKDAIINQNSLFELKTLPFSKTYYLEQNNKNGRLGYH